MAMTLERWVRDFATQKIEEVEGQGLQKVFENSFQRDPEIPIFYSQEYFLTPASGTIFNQKIVGSKNELLNIKGKEYTLKEMFGKSNFNWDTTNKYMVSQTFLTFLDIHHCRMPTDGFVKFERLNALLTRNKSMVNFEYDILDRYYNPDNAEYQFYNERVVVEVTNPQLDLKYYMVLLGDLDVNVISMVKEQNSFYRQGEKFAYIRRGSQCDLIIPLTKYLIFKPSFNFDVSKEKMHVEAGADVLVNLDF